MTPVDANAARVVVERSLGCALGDCFANFSPQPFACGSVSQVHLATLADGRRVAVKVRRPGIEEFVAADFAVFRGVAAFLERLPGLRMMPLGDAVGEWHGAIARQLDFAAEARAHTMFARNLVDLADVEIPTLMSDFTRGDVLVMSYMDGLTAIDDPRLPAAARSRAAAVGLELLYRMIFRDGLIHADLHPGNLFVQADGTLVCLDFGLTAELDPPMRAKFTEFFWAMSINDGDRCARIVIETAERLPLRFEPERFEAAMRQMVGRHAGKPAGEFEVAAFASDLFALQRRFGVRGSTAFTMTIYALLVFAGVLRGLVPSLDFQRAAVRFMLGGRATASAT